MTPGGDVAVAPVRVEGRVFVAEGGSRVFYGEFHQRDERWPLTLATKNIPRRRGGVITVQVPFSPIFALPRAHCCLGMGDRAEQGFHFQFSIFEETRPAGMRTGYVLRPGGLLRGRPSALLRTGAHPRARGGRASAIQVPIEGRSRPSCPSRPGPISLNST